MLSKHSGKTGKWFPKRSLRRRILWFLSCLVVFCTTYALILPAITLANETYCHLDEHQHDENCFRSPKPLCNQESPENGTAPPHEHDESCYDENQNLICDKQEQTTVHQHTDECYRSDKPLCGKEEHTHSKMCYSNQEDVEKKEDWEKTLPEKLDGTTRENLISVAESQIGYKENETNFILDSDENVKNYSRYGERYGKPYEDWNLMFIDFVLNYSGVEHFPIHEHFDEWLRLLEENNIPLHKVKDSDLTKMVNKESESVGQESKSFYPENGDLIIFDYIIKEKDQKVTNLVGIVNLKENGVLEFITGDIEGEVQSLVFDTENVIVHSFISLSNFTDDELGDNESDNNDHESDSGRPETENGPDLNEPENDDSGNDENIGEPLSKEIDWELAEEFYEAESENFSFRIKPVKTEESNEEITDSSDELTEDDELASELVEKSDEVQTSNLSNKAETAEASNDKESTAVDEFDSELDTKDLKPQLIVDDFLNKNEAEDDQSEYQIEFKFRLGEDSVNLKQYEFELEVIPKEKVIQPYIQNISESAADAEVGTEITVLSENEDEDSESSIVISDSEDSPTIKRNSTSNKLMVRVRKLPNPEFTVQTYGWIPTPQLSDTQTDGSIPVFNQTGQTFPSTEKYVGLKPVEGTNKYSLNTPEKLTEIYSSQNCSYHSYPNLMYFDQLKNNTSYVLDEVWKLKDGKKSTSIKREDFDIYPSSSVKFTNRPETINESNKNEYVLIENKDIIRLVYKQQATLTYQTSASFYDYNISEGTCSEGHPVHKSSNTLDGGYGINNKANYSNQTGSRYAFGNANTAYQKSDNLASEKFNGLNLNRGNSGGAMVTGIVTGLTSDNKLKFAKGIAHPNLFDDGSAVGKTEIKGGQLLFKQSGDSYTLTGVQGGGLSLPADNDLSLFNHPKCGDTTYTTIWTNNFWPMDSLETVDPKSGQRNDVGDYHVGIKPGERCPGINDTDKSKTYPPSDDGLAHNSLFGMRVDIKFNIDEKYIGPMNYFFFGDDDLWAFIDGKKIADIGGVKSSKGVYVDIKSLGLAPGDHVLSVFYTERGLSGSTCYMQFTLPSVSALETGQTTGGFNLHKVTEDMDSETSFEFEVTFKDANGNQLKDDYAYQKYNKDGDTVSPGSGEDRLIIASNDVITLKKDEYIVVEYLPIGTIFTVTEKLDPGGNTKVSFSSQNGTYIESTDHSYTGIIKNAGESVPVYCQNIRFFALPETGGAGIDLLYHAGISLLAAAGTVSLIRYRKKRGGSP